MARVPVVIMRGGASKGAYFLASDLPAADPDPEPLPVLGVGEVAVVGPSADPRADVDHLGATPPCGDILAGVGPFAIERGLVAACGDTTTVRVRVTATGTLATVHVPTPGGRPEYAGGTAISGVPGTAARILVEYGDAVLPTGRVLDDLGGVPVSLIDNGMPVVFAAASSLGVSGHESPARLEYDEGLRWRIEALRMAAGERMGLGDVRERPGPAVCLLAPPAAGGSLCTRTFVARRVHPGIDALTAVAAALPGRVAAGPAAPEPGGVLRLEHPSGFVDVTGSAVVTTARLLLDGHVHW